VTGEDDRQRLARTYSAYRASSRKQHAWSAKNPGNIAIRRELAEVVGDVAGARLRTSRRILDVGCGGGWWLAELAGGLAPTAELHGIDLLEQRIAAASERLSGARLTIGDARALPYGDGEFDAVFLFIVLSSIPEAAGLDRALAEALRVLAPGGLLLVWEPRFPNPLNRRTAYVSGRRLRAALGSELGVRSTTLLPLIARRLGKATPWAYPWLSRISALRSHRLVYLKRRETE
jgi:ubiquinone/menaquinone biosynthesis C-methylase UbiE